MKKLLTTIMFVFSSIIVLSQTITITTPDTIDCNRNYTLNAAVSLPQIAKGGYKIESIPYNPPCQMGLGTIIETGFDDNWSSMQTIPFEFKYFDSTYSQFCVSENGILTFYIEYAEEDCPWNFPNPCLFPDTNLDLNATILACYSDLKYPQPEDIFNPEPIDSTIGVFQTIIGTEPERALCVTWNKLPMFNEPDSIVTLMLVLYESTNVIEFYIEKAPNISWNYGRKACGIINQDGTEAFIVPGKNTGNWSAYTEAWRITPENDNNYKVYWYEGVDTTAPPIAYGAHTTYDPYDGHTYTARLQYNDYDDVIDSKTIIVESRIPQIYGPQHIVWSPYYIGHNELAIDYYIDPWEYDSIRWELSDCYNWYFLESPQNEIYGIRIQFVTIFTYPAPSGTLWLTVYTKRCGVITNHIDITTSMIGLCESEQTLKAYPNPTTGMFYIETELQGSAEVVVYNTEGKQVLSQTSEGGTIAIDLGNQPAGLYYYAIINNDKRLSGKVLKK